MKALFDMPGGLALTLAAVKLPKNIRAFFQTQGRIGAEKRFASLSREEKSALARHAAQSRWAKEKKAKKASKKSR